MQKDGQRDVRTNNFAETRNVQERSQGAHDNWALTLRLLSSCTQPLLWGVKECEGTFVGRQWWQRDTNLRRAIQPAG